MAEQPLAAIEQGWCLEDGPSVLAPELIESYCQARYGVSWLADEWVRLEVGARSEMLEAILGMTGCSTTAFVTAANPFGISCGEDDNRRRNEALAQAVAAAGWRALPGRGEDPSGAWPGEDSLLVLGPSRSDAEALGRQFNQNAILWSDERFVPQLLLLR